jgi:hypothetical protein
MDTRIAHRHLGDDGWHYGSDRYRSIVQCFLRGRSITEETRQQARLKHCPRDVRLADRTSDRGDFNAADGVKK